MDLLIVLNQACLVWYSLYKEVENEVDHSRRLSAMVACVFYKDRQRYNEKCERHGQRDGVENEGYNEGGCWWS